MKKHGTNMLMVDATHNTVDNYFLSESKKIYLYTFMIRNPVTGNGVPVAWVFTSSLAE